MEDNLYEMVYEPSQYDNDVQMRPVVKPDGF